MCFVLCFSELRDVGFGVVIVNLYLLNPMFQKIRYICLDFWTIMQKLKEEKSDLQLFNHFFKTYQQKFIRFANFYVRDLAVAEDFTIESLLNYWEKRHLLSQDTNPKAYVLASIKNRCLNYLQHLQTRSDFEEEKHVEWKLSVRITALEACNPVELFATDIQKIVNETLKKLPGRTKEIFLLSREKNLSQKEIAEITGMTIKGVEFHISKAIKVLRKSLKDYINILLLY